MTTMSIGASSASLILLGALSAGTATAQSIVRSATYRERMALPPTAVIEDVTMRSVAADQTAPLTAGGSRPLEGTYWRVTELAGKPTPKQNPETEAQLQFQKGRVFGSDGCNRVTGSYQLNGDRVTFSQMAGTMMACISGTDGPFLDA